MHILIIGAAGMVGRKLTTRLLADKYLGQSGISRLTLIDVVKADAPVGGGIEILSQSMDVSDPSAMNTLSGSRPDVIFHLAAIVSGEAEAEFEKGYRVNLDATRNLLEAIRLEGQKSPYKPRLVFTSSLAVFGAPVPDVIEEAFLTAPLTSYGTQKAIGELLLNDYSRRGFVDGIAIRLPTICIRPGKPNKAASGFFSGILREPLVGQEAVLPVSDDVLHWHASPRSATQFLVHAATIDIAALGSRRALMMPGLAATVGQQIEALRKVAGDKAVRLIRRAPDEAVASIIAGWPKAFNPARALALGFKAESSFEEIIRIHIEDELGGKIA